MAGQKQILVFGAGGTTGREIVARALDEGHVVHAAEKDPPAGMPDHERLRLSIADVLRDDLAPLMEGADTVISALGVGLTPQTTLDPPPLYSEGTLRIVEAMKGAGLRRLVVISASFVGGHRDLPLWFRAMALPALHQVITQMADMERILRASDAIDWTAVRPGWLLDAPHTGDYTVAENTIPRGMIRTRHADLADFMLRCATSADWLRAFPAIARREPLRESGPHALVAEFLSAMRPRLPHRSG